MITTAARLCSHADNREVKIGYQYRYQLTTEVASILEVFHPRLQVFLLKVRWKAVLFKNTAYIYSSNILIDITLLNCLLNGTECVVSCEECKEEGIVCNRVEN